MLGAGVGKGLSVINENALLFRTLDLHNAVSGHKKTAGVATRGLFVDVAVGAYTRCYSGPAVTTATYAASISALI